MIERISSKPVVESEGITAIALLWFAVYGVLQLGSSGKVSVLLNPVPASRFVD